eukprot:403365471
MTNQFGNYCLDNYQFFEEYISTNCQDDQSYNPNDFTISFNAPKKQMIFQSDLKTECYYHFKLTVQNIGSQSIVFQEYQISIVNCYSEEIITQNIKDQQVDIAQNANPFTITFLSFIVIKQGCNNIEYKLVDESHPSNDLPSFITRVNDLKYIIDPKLEDDMGLFILTLIGSLGANNSKSVTFTLTIINSCMNPNITNTSSLDVDFMQTENQQIIDLSSIVINPSYCGSFSYTVKNVPQDIVVLSQQQFQFKIDKISNIGQYQNQTYCEGGIQSQINLDTDTYPFSMDNINQVQEGSQFIFTIEIHEQEFSTYSLKPILFQIRFFNPRSEYDTMIEYNLTVIDYQICEKRKYQPSYFSSKELDNYITYQSIFNEDFKGSYQFSIQVTNSKLVRDEPYQITFQLETNNSDQSITYGTFKYNITIFQLKLDDAIEGIASTLKIIKMYTEISQTINFPQLDLDSYIIEVDYGKARKFIKGSYPNYIVNPGKFDEGEYEIYILIKDKVKNLKIYQQTTQLKVVTNIIQIDIPDDSDIEDKNIMVVTNKTLISQSLNANIKSIGMSGEVKIKFNNAIFQPKNYQIFNDSITLVEIYDIDGVKQNYKFSWQITDFSILQYQMKIKFDDPAQVSRNGKDQLRITYIQNGYFIEQKSRQFISLNYQISKDIPNQLRTDGFSKGMQEFAGVISNALKGVTYGTLALNLIFLIIDLSNFDVFSEAFSSLQFFDFSENEVENAKHIQEFREGSVFLIIDKINIRSDQFGAFLTMMIFVLSLSFFLGSTMLLLLSFDYMRTQSFKNKYGEFYEGINAQNFISIFNTPVQLFRRLFFAIIVVYMGNYPGIQVILMLLLTLMLLIYLVLVKPYELRSQNNQEIFNEVCILACTYHQIAFADDQINSDIQYNTGWCLILITIINITTNSSILLVNVFGSLRSFIKTQIQKYKQRIQTSKMQQIYQNKQNTDVDNSIFQNGKFRSNYNANNGLNSCDVETTFTHLNQSVEDEMINNSNFNSPQKYNKPKKTAKKFSYNLNLASVDNEGFYTINKQIGVSNMIEEGDVSHQFVEQFNQRQKNLLQMLEEIQESNSHYQDKIKKQPIKSTLSKKHSKKNEVDIINHAQKNKKIKSSKIKSIASSLYKEKKKPTKIKNKTIYSDQAQNQQNSSITFNQFKGLNNQTKSKNSSTFQAITSAQPQRNNFVIEKQTKKNQETKVQSIDQQIEELKNIRYEKMKKVIQQNYDDGIRSSLEVNVGRK